MSGVNFVYHLRQQVLLMLMWRSPGEIAGALGLMATLLSAGANAQAPTSPPQDRPTFEDTVQVTATRFGEAVAEVPGSISVLTGDEIRARGATDLRTALALLAASASHQAAMLVRPAPSPACWVSARWTICSC